MEKRYMDICKYLLISLSSFWCSLSFDQLKKYFTRKVKKIYRANIMILVLFIMFVSSLLGLLVSQYVQHLISISSLFQDYYRSYYYAYAGLEVWLAQVKHHGYGFEQGRTSDYIYDDFSECFLWTWWCAADITITARWNPLADTYETRSDCDALSTWADSDHSFYTVSSGNAVIIPLFYDSTTGFTTVADTSYTVFSWDALEDDIAPVVHVEDISSTWTYLIQTIDEDSNSITLTPTISDYPDGYKFMTDLLAAWTLSNTQSNKNYLIIANTDGETKDFCIYLSGSWSPEMVSKYVVIESIGKYGDVTASLSAIKVEQLPSFLGYGTIDGRE